MAKEKSPIIRIYKSSTDAHGGTRYFLNQITAGYSAAEKMSATKTSAMISRIIHRNTKRRRINTTLKIPPDESETSVGLDIE